MPSYADSRVAVGHNIQELKDGIQRLVCIQKQMGQSINNSWLLLEAMLEELKFSLRQMNQVPIISRDKLVKFGTSLQPYHFGSF